MDIPEPLKHCYTRTLRIVTLDGTSSSFVMNHKGQQWLVTAIHVVEDRSGNEKPFEVLDQNGANHSGLVERLPRISLADVAVFRLRTETLDFGPPLEPYGPHDVRATQGLYFLGFPDLGDRGIYGLTYASPTIPFIKQAIVSGEADHYHIKAWLLDGMSNGGFSGGPVIIQEQDSESYRVFGVASSYVPANAGVTPARVAAVPPRAGVVPPAPNDRFFETNSGLVIVFDIRHAVETIDAWLSTKPSR
jgi:hypothetical protein